MQTSLALSALNIPSDTLSALNMPLDTLSALNAPLGTLSALPRLRESFLELLSEQFSKSYSELFSELASGFQGLREKETKNTDKAGHVASPTTLTGRDCRRTERTPRRTSQPAPVWDRRASPNEARDTDYERPRLQYGTQGSLATDKDAVLRAVAHRPRLSGGTHRP